MEEENALVPYKTRTTQCKSHDFNFDFGVDIRRRDYLSKYIELASAQEY